MSTKKSLRFFSKVHSFFTYKIPFFFKYDFRDYIPHILAVLFAVTGIYAWKEDTLWMLIVGGVVAFFARMYGYVVQMINSDALLKPLMSSVVLLIVSVIGSFLIRSRIEIGFIESVFLSLNGMILVFYVLIVIFVIVKTLVSKALYEISMWKSAREIKIEVADQALQAAGLTRKQVKQLKVSHLQHDPEKEMLFYVVSFSHGDRQYGYKVWK